MQQPRSDILLYDFGDMKEEASVDLLQKIQSQNIPIGYRFCAHHPEQYRAFRAGLEAKGLPPAALIWMARSREDPLLLFPTSCLDNTAVQALFAPPTLQLAHLLAALSAYLRASLEAGSSVEEAMREVLIVQAAEPDFYHELAKLRAMRRCIAKVVMAFGGTAASLRSFRILGTTHPAYRTCLDTSMNLLRHTTQALSMVLGGVSELMVLPHLDPEQGSESVDAARLALNIAQLLAAETDLGQLTDPAAGAYFFEALTDRVARVAWQRFQEIEARGGLSAAEVQKDFLEVCRRNAERCNKMLETAQQPMIGVNIYLQAEATPRGPRATQDSSLYIFSMPSVAAKYEGLRRSAQDSLTELAPLYMALHEGVPSATRMKRYWQDTCTAVDLRCPETWASPSAPLPETPCLLIAVFPEACTEVQLAELLNLCNAQAARGGLSCLGGRAEDCPAAFAQLQNMYYVSFPREANLAGWQRFQRRLYETP